MEAVGRGGINFNMGCFEIRIVCACGFPRHGLTLTWDVLKSMVREKERTTKWRLTLTWDVLKSVNLDNFIRQLTD